MERLRREEEAASAAREREQLGQAVCGLEQELAGKRDEVQTVQVRGCWAIAGDGAGVTLWGQGELFLNKPLQI